MPRAQLRTLPSSTREGAAAVYFPACVNRIFGRDPGQSRRPSLPQVLVEVSARAGQPLWIPGDVAGKCCSTPWSSKGYLRGHKWMAATTCDALWSGAARHVIARRWATGEKLARTAVGAADIIQRTIGVRALTGLTAAARLVVSDDLIPSVPGPMPRAQLRTLPATTREGAAAVYFPACVNRIFGRDPGQARHPSLPQALVEVSARAGKPLWIPGDVAGKCCSTPWSSKGYLRGHKWMAATTCDALWEWSGHGTMPVVIDAASCTNGLLDDVKNYLDETRRARLEQITLLDSIAWCDRLLPALTVTERVERAAVHPTCSTTHLGLTKTLERLAGRLAGEVLVPVGTTCCGTAGDRGLLHPELVISATRDEKTGLDQTPAQAYLSANRTCEMGLRQATGYPYESFVFLLEELTRPA